MAEKVLNARLQLKYDSYENWSKAAAQSFVPKKGEVCFVEVPASAGSGLREPALLFKVGDGTKTFAQLPYGSAKAADVNTYALQNDSQFKTTIESWISGKVQDSDTYKEFKLVSNGDDGKYKLQFRTVDVIAGTTTNWADVSDGVAIDVSDAFGRIGDLEELVGDTAVETQISDAIAALDLANTYAGKAYEAKVTTLEGEMDTAQADISALETKVGDTAVATQISTAIGALDGAVTGSGFASYISQTDGKVTATLRALTAADIPTISLAKISDAGDLAALDEVAESNLASALASKINGKQDQLAFKNNDYDAETNKVVTENDIKGIAGGMHFKGVKTSLPTDLDDYEAGDLIIVGTAEYVLNVKTDGTKEWLELGDEGKYAIKGNIVNADIAANAAIAQSKIAGLTDDLAGKVDVEDGKSLVDDDEIERLAGMSDGANKVEGATSNGYIKVDGVDNAIKVYTLPENVVEDSAYKHITVTTTSVSDGSATFNKYDDTALAARVTTAEGDIDALESGKQDKIDATHKLSYELVSGLGTLATKSSVAKTDLASALKTEIEGKADSADLAEIATTGNVNDLVQTSNDVLVLNCGSSTVNI